MTVKQYHGALSDMRSETYCIKSIKNKLSENYGENEEFINRFKIAMS